MRAAVTPPSLPIAAAAATAAATSARPTLCARSSASTTCARWRGRRSRRRWRGRPGGAGGRLQRQQPPPLHRSPLPPLPKRPCCSSTQSARLASRSLPPSLPLPRDLTLLLPRGGCTTQPPRRRRPPPPSAPIPPATRFIPTSRALCTSSTRGRQLRTLPRPVPAVPPQHRESRMPCRGSRYPPSLV